MLRYANFLPALAIAAKRKVPAVQLWQSDLIFSWLRISAAKLERYSLRGSKKENLLFFGPLTTHRLRRPMRKIGLVRGRQNGLAASAERKAQGIHRALVVHSMPMSVGFRLIRKVDRGFMLMPATHRSWVLRSAIKQVCGVGTEIPPLCFGSTGTTL